MGSSFRAAWIQSVSASDKRRAAVGNGMQSARVSAFFGSGHVGAVATNLGDDYVPLMTVTSNRLFQQPWPEGDYRLFQLGFVVDDIVKVATRWARIHGVGPFFVRPRMNVSCSYRGTPGRLEMQVASAQAGPAQIELIAQYCDTPSIYREFVAKGHSVFHQICTVTPEYDAKKAYYEALGIELASEIIVPGQRVAFYDTVNDFGLFTEVAEQSDAFLENLGQRSQICAQWDGADPVRLLTEDGYRPLQEGDV